MELSWLPVSMRPGVMYYCADYRGTWPNHLLMKYPAACQESPCQVILSRLYYRPAIAWGLPCCAPVMNIRVSSQSSYFFAKKLVLSPTILVTPFCNPAQRIPWKSTETVSNLAGRTVAQQWKGIVTLCCSAVCFVRSNQSGPQLSLPPKGGSSWVGGHTQRWGSKHSKMQLYWEVSVDFVRRKDLSITDPKLYQFSGKCLKTRNPKFATCAK